MYHLENGDKNTDEKRVNLRRISFKTVVSIVRSWKKLKLRYSHVWVDLAPRTPLVAIKCLTVGHCCRAGGQFGEGENLKIAAAILQRCAKWRMLGLRTQPDIASRKLRRSHNLWEGIFLLSFQSINDTLVDKRKKSVAFRYRY